MTCSDFPCCGHEAGCCPDFDPETGEQLNMICTCGAKLPVTSQYSICQTCMRKGGDDFGGPMEEFEIESSFDPEDDDDVESDEYDGLDGAIPFDDDPPDDDPPDDDEY